MTLDELKKFCADEGDIRFYLREPWSRDGFTWATNGHVIVRVPEIEGVLECGAAPDALKMMSKQAPAKNWITVPAVDDPGKRLAECPTCHGDGIHECTCGDEHKCENCEGKGTVKERDIAVPVGDSAFADRYLFMLAGWEISPNGPSNPAWIRNGDVDGLLMPLRVA